LRSSNNSLTSVIVTINTIRNIGQGEARHKKYKRLKLSGGGGQADDRSIDRSIDCLDSGHNRQHV